MASRCVKSLKYEQLSWNEVFNMQYECKAETLLDPSMSSCSSVSCKDSCPTGGRTWYLLFFTESVSQHEILSSSFIIDHFSAFETKRIISIPVSNPGYFTFTPATPEWFNPGEFLGFSGGLIAFRYVFLSNESLQQFKN